MNYLMTLTDKQLVRLFNNIIRRIFEAFAGGTQYGFDMPTLYAVLPEWYVTYMLVRNEGRRRTLERKR